MTALINTVTAEGSISGATAPLSMESELTIQMLDLELAKTADQLYWGNGPLTYSITITNNETEAYEDIELTDIIDVSKVDFVEDSVEIGGVSTTYTYTEATGTLVVSVDEVAAGSSKVVTFQVTKK